MKRLLPFLLIVLFIPFNVYAEEPILTIDAGGHKAIIRDVMFTKDGRYLVSTSDDKTIRVWDASAGEVMRVFRGQIGTGHEGTIFAMALSPDNRFLAVGGYPARWGIRLINFHTGQKQNSS